MYRLFQPYISSLFLEYIWYLGNSLHILSKSDWKTITYNIFLPVRTSAGSHPTRPSPLNPEGHSHVYPGTRLTQVAPGPQPFRERLLHSLMSEKENLLFIDQECCSIHKICRITGQQTRHHLYQNLISITWASEIIVNP